MDVLLGQSVRPKEIRNSNSSIPCIHSSELRCKKQMFQTTVRCLVLLENFWIFIQNTKRVLLHFKSVCSYVWYLR